MIIFDGDYIYVINYCLGMGMPSMFNKKKSKLPKPSQPLKSFNWSKIPDVSIPDIVCDMYFIVRRKTGFYFS